METSRKRAEIMEKRGGGKKSGPNTVHGAHQKFPDLRPLQQNSRKLMTEDGHIPYVNLDRTSLTLNQQGIANPIHTSELGENENLSPQNRSFGVAESGQMGCNEAHRQSFELDVDRNRPRTCKIGADLDMENDEAVLMNMKKGGEVRGIPDLENTAVKRRSGGTLRMTAGEDLEMTEVDTGPDVCYGEKVVTDVRENDAQYTDDTDCVEKDFPRLGNPTRRTVGALPESYNRSQRRGRPMARPPLAGYPSTRGDYKRRDFSSRRSRGPVGLREMENGVHSDWVGNGSRFADQTWRNGMWQEKGSRNVVQQGRTFASLLNSNPMEKSMKLSYVEPGLNGEKPVFCPKESDLLEAKKKWETYIVGYFISGSLTTNSVERIAKGYWGKLGLGKVLADSSGFYFFQIPDDSARMKILEEGPWLFYGRNMVLQQWSPELVLCKQTHGKIPLWVRFHKVPLALWTAGGLSGIASLIGKPLYADSYTENMIKIDFARICVEVDAKRPLPESVQVCIRGNTFDIPVDYQWKPVRCPKCEAFGHLCKEEQKASQQVDNLQLPDKGKTPMTDEPKTMEKEEFTLVRRKRSNRGGVKGPIRDKSEEPDTHPMADEVRIGQSEVSPTNAELTVELDQPMVGNVAKTVISDASEDGNLQSTDDSDGSTDGNSSDDDTGNSIRGTGQHSKLIQLDQVAGKQEINRGGSQFLNEQGTRMKSTTAQVVAAMPNSQFQGINQKAQPKKARKSSGGSKSSKTRRR